MSGFLFNFRLARLKPIAVYTAAATFGVTAAGATHQQLAVRQIEGPAAVEGHSDVGRQYLSGCSSQPAPTRDGWRPSFRSTTGWMDPGQLAAQLWSASFFGEQASGEQDGQSTGRMTAGSSGSRCSSINSSSSRDHYNSPWYQSKLQPLLLLLLTEQQGASSVADGYDSWQLLPHTRLLRYGLQGDATWHQLQQQMVAAAEGVQQLGLVPLRLARDIVAAVAIAADYSWSLRGLPAGSEQRERAKRQCHERGAKWLQWLCFANGGVYIKLGQHVGQLDHLLPSEYVLGMRRVMLHRCPLTPPSAVRRLLQAELGAAAEELFLEFDETPVASASLAQVHRAKLKDGTAVAVKGRWLVAEVEQSLPQELDFLHEASNAARCSRNIRASPHLRGRVVVPQAFAELSTSRVLVMEWMDGCHLSDAESIKRLRLNPADVARLISRTFSEMIFTHGFVHCDPHAANLLVRPMSASCPLSSSPRSSGRWLEWVRRVTAALLPSSLIAIANQPQLVLLDHGLYRTLDDEMRLNYAALWQALVFADESRIKKFSVALGAGEDLFALFAAMVTMRSWDQILDPSLDHLDVPTTDDEKKRLQGYAAQYFDEINVLLARLPRVVLLLLKTNDCLRSVDFALGTPVNTFVTTARESTKALAKAQKEKGTMSGVLASFLTRIHVEFRILVLQLGSHFAKLNELFL